MHGKPGVGPDNSCIFDNDDVEQLDDLPRTSVRGQANLSLDEPVEAAAEVVSSEADDEPSIDELLGDFRPESDENENEASPDSDLEDTGTHLVAEVLMSPEEMFSKDEIDGEM